MSDWEAVATRLEYESEHAVQKQLREDIKAALEQIEELEQEKITFHGASVWADQDEALREENARLVELNRYNVAQAKADIERLARERDDVRAEASKRITDEWAMIARALGRFTHPALSPGENVLELVKDLKAAEAKLARCADSFGWILVACGETRSDAAKVEAIRELARAALAAAKEE